MEKHPALEIASPDCHRRAHRVVSFHDPAMITSDSNRLCSECGLCCNGVIFADVRLQPSDEARHLRSLGLKLARVSNRRRQIASHRFAQPCAAHDGCRCRIYFDRPQYCREFECGLLRQVKAGRMEDAAALETIREALQCVETVRQLLRELDNTDEHMALSLRFKRLKRRMESRATDDDAAEVFGRLTLAVHHLNVLLAGAFYPGGEHPRPAG